MPNSDDWFASRKREVRQFENLHLAIVNNRPDFSRYPLNVKNKKIRSGGKKSPPPLISPLYVKLNPITRIAAG